MQQNDAKKMASAQQAMQKQMSEMQSQQQSASEQAKQARAAAQSAQASMQGLGGHGVPSDQGQPTPSSTGKPTAGNGNGGGSGSGQGGHEHSELSLTSPSERPAFSIRVERPPPGAQQTTGGKVLADFLVKGALEKGEAHQQLRNVITAAQRQSPQDADQETIDAGARRTVKEYFQAVQEDK
jgi:hypothetical protein